MDRDRENFWSPDKGKFWSSDKKEFWSPDKEEFWIPDKEEFLNREGPRLFQALKSYLESPALIPRSPSSR